MSVVPALLFFLGLVGFVLGAFIGHCGKEALAREEFVCLLYGESLRQEAKGKTNTANTVPYATSRAFFQSCMCMPKYRRISGRRMQKSPIRVEAMPRK